IPLTVHQQLAVTASAVARIETTLTLFEQMLTSLDDKLVGTGFDQAVSHGQPFVDRVRANVAVMAGGGRPADKAALDTLAARMLAADVDALLNGIIADLAAGGGIRASQQGKCNDILDRADHGMEAINDFTDLAGYEPPAGDTVADMHSYAFSEWWNWVKKTTLGIDEA